MIPKQLILEGLYSYQKRQTIDFDNLINAGLFGIFGSVGSGKSSILEGITFALYGETERLNAKEKRAYNMMNLKSDRAYICFDFVNYNDITYRIEREFKRNSKRFDDIKSPTVVLYQKINEKWVPQNNHNIQDIVGLSYDNFKRTIIIPQGKFKEFIELKPTERTQMLKEIFKLHQYDLFDKVAILNSENSKALNQLEGKLSEFNEVTEDIITQLKQDLEDQTKIQTEKASYFKEINEKLQHLKRIKSDVELLNSYKNQFELLAARKKEIDLKKSNIDTYDCVYKAFNHLLIAIKNCELDINNTSNKINADKEGLQETIAELQHTEELLLELKNYIADLPNKRLQETDLELIGKIQRDKHDIVVLKNRTANGELKVSEIENSIKTIIQQIKETENIIQTYAEKQIDTSILIQAGEWYSKQLNFKKELSTKENTCIKLANEISKIEKELLNENINSSTFENNTKATNTRIENQKKELTEKIQHCQVQQRLAEFTTNLHNGESCPLCGSNEHPNILQIDDVSNQLIILEEEFKILEKEQVSAFEYANNMRLKIQKLTLLKEQFLIEDNQLKIVKEAALTHDETFIWQEFDLNDYEDFSQKKKLSLDLADQINAKNKFIAAQRNLLENNQENAQKYKNALENFRLEETEKQTQIDQNISNLKILNYVDFATFSSDTIKQQLIDLKELNNKKANDFEEYTEKYNQLHTKIEIQKATIASNEALEQDFKTKLTDLNNNFNHELINLTIDNKHQVTEILNQNLNSNVIRKEIEDFNISFQTVNNQIADLELKLKDTSFNNTIFAQIEKDVISAESELQLANENVIKTTSELARLSEAYTNKKALLIKYSELSKRSENLKTMSNLFKAAGFVQYVSTIYLKQLCENANIRFRKMTRNQLSLQINDNNDFEVVDYLNEGRTRSVKTLSGGQAFQVSLSLALALAESVQTNSLANKNFFFIDEGFGTQDAESVNIVFETLNNLHKENRIVGIISHVEELKERIPAALQITKTDSEGSMIEYV